MKVSQSAVIGMLPALHEEQTTCTMKLKGVFHQLRDMIPVGGRTKVV